MRRLRNAKISRIALCRKGKNNLRTIYKSDGAVEFQALTKSQEEGELLCVIYAPNLEDIEGEGMEPAEVKKACHNAMKSGVDIEFEHFGDPLPREDAWLAETFIVHKSDTRFHDWKDYNDQPVGDLTGAWAGIIKLGNDELRRQAREGEIDGASMFGEAIVERTSKSASTIRERLEAAHTKIDMTPEEIKALITEQFTELAKSLKPEPAPVPAPAKPVAKATEPVAKATEPELPERPLFTGDATDADALSAFQAELATWELNCKIVKGEITAEELAATVAKAKEVAPSDAEAGIEKEDSEEVQSLKRKLHKAQKRSNVAPVAKSLADDLHQTDDPDPLKVAQMMINLKNTGKFELPTS